MYIDENITYLTKWDNQMTERQIMKGFSHNQFLALKC